MAYEEKIRPAAKAHHVILEERNRLSVTGVEDVASFDENEIVMTTAQAISLSGAADCTSES